MFEKNLKLACLLDFYGEVLSERKQSVLSLYYNEDLSLAEIAEEIGISRQGVHDIVKRCTKKLKEYESALHLVEKFQNMKEKLTEVTELLNTETVTGSNTDIQKAKQLLNEVIAEL